MRSCSSRTCSCLVLRTYVCFFGCHWSLCWPHNFVSCRAHGPGMIGQGCLILCLWTEFSSTEPLQHHCLTMFQEGGKFTHPWQPTKLNSWNSVCLSMARHHIKAYYDVPGDQHVVPEPDKPGHALPIEQGRFARPAVPRHLRRCTVCNTQAVGDELHCVFDCPRFSDIRAQFPGLFQDAAGSMRMFMWHKDQKSVCHCLIALLQKAQT